MKKQGKRLETSKKILASSWAATITLSALCIIGAFLSVDMGSITPLASLAWGELTTAHAFYYWKAKNENRAKGAQKLVKDMAETYGIDTAARFTEIIYK